VVTPPPPPPPPPSEAVIARLEDVEFQMTKLRLDLGELMVVYDDMQVGKSCK
jgi:hypothetical protein